MVLSDLVKLDRRFPSTGSLGEALGHGFLMIHNPLYRGIILSAVDAGFRFVRAWESYNFLGICELDRILSERKIPVVPNRAIYLQLRASYLDRFGVGEIPNKVRSHHLHEAAHAVAQDLTAAIRPSSPRRRVLLALICESFANAVESMSLTYMNSPEHETFIFLNSYIFDSPKEIRMRRRLRDKIGKEATFFLIMMSYLHSNFLWDTVTERKVIEWLAFWDPAAKLDRTTRKLALGVAQIALELNLEFRASTNQFFFRNLGIESEITDLLNFDFEKNAFGSPAYRSALRMMVRVATAEPPPEKLNSRPSGPRARARQMEL